MRTLPTSFAQNSIDYMVLHNTESVRQLISEQGYEPPLDAHELVLTTKELIREKGTSVIEKLLALHPDKNAILTLNTPNKKAQCNSCSKDTYNSEDNFCGSCGHSNYNGSGDEDSFLDQFSDTSDKQLERYYKTAVKKSNSDPKDKNLASEVQMIWNEIRQRKAAKNHPKATDTNPISFISGYGQDRLVLIGLVFVAGILVGSSFKKTTVL